MVKKNELKATIKRLKKFVYAEDDAEKLARQGLIFIDKEFTSKDLYIDKAILFPKHKRRDNEILY